MRDAAGQLADRLKALVMNRAQATMDQLDELVKVEIQEALDDLGHLMVLQLTDPKNPVVERELAHVKARLANWTFVGADLVVDAVKAAVQETVELLGRFARGFL